ncbi:MAG: D-alanine--D-alanine ligase [Armatimonadota bacterium]|nr:D-alanine--D-alanine ligase [Armatimonadota bacterium]
MANSKDKIRVALLIGGDSSERPVSFASGKAIAAALKLDRFAVTAFDVASEATRAQAHGESNFLSVACHPLAWDQLATTLRVGDFDVALPALHGGWGEDGTLQSLLEVAGVPYVGSPQRASMIAIDKQVCKAVMRDLGIPVPKGRVVYDWAEWEQAPTLDAPCVVKPNAGGSSLAVTIIREPMSGRAAAVRDAVELALRDGSGALIEELVEGMEVTAAVLGEGRAARVLPLLEIVPQSAGGFYDFEAKYTPGGSQHITPPRLPSETLDCIADYALRAHRALGCQGVARSDFIVGADGIPYFLEINTLPGMTEMSLVPDAARAEGVSFEQLLETLIMDALRKE